MLALACWLTCACLLHATCPADAPRGSLPPADDPAAAAALAAGRQLYADSIESLVRNEIQRTKIEMASEVIDAGRWAQDRFLTTRSGNLGQVKLGLLACSSLGRCQMADWYSWL
jgi:hypothetical protein